jgi:hypothetical protein
MHTSLEIVISPLAHPNVNGLPFASRVLLTHSSGAHQAENLPFDQADFPGNAENANDLSSLFAEGAIPKDDGDDDNR